MNYYDFIKINQAKDLDVYFEKRWKLHNKYFHYSSLKTINSILDNDEIWLTQVKNLNDKNDLSQFDNPNINFALCFSIGLNENLPLWYLYGGIQGNGGCLYFSNKGFKNFVENSKFYLFEIHNKQKFGKPVLTINNINADIVIKDILYYKKDNSKIHLKYNNLTNYITSVKEFNKYKNSNQGFLKGLIWYYEKETRILIRLKDSFADIIDNKKDYIIVMKNANLKKYANIKLGPKITNVSKGIKDYRAIKTFVKFGGSVELSEYKGTVDFDLCSKKCDYRRNK